jgi:cytochrome c oxidase subunit 1
MPAYIAFYTLVPRAIGGRLYSDTMARVAFVLFLVFSMPIGIHHLFADPHVGSGFKFVHAAMTALVSVPTLLTVFTITASVEIAARLRGGKGAFGWVKALPWSEPMMLALAFSFVMLGFGGAGGLINMSYQLDFTIHNTQWITGHFHLIFAGAIVIMYFAIAYDLWPHLTGKALESIRLMRTQLWLWFIGMLVVTFPWHYVGILGMPRRMAYFDYSHPAVAPQAIYVSASVIGGLLLLASAVLFVLILVRGHLGNRIALPEFRFSLPVHATAKVPAALNSFGLWLALTIALTLVNYGYPIGQLMALKQTSVPAVPVVVK